MTKPQTITTRDELPLLFAHLTAPKVVEVGVLAGEYTDIYVPQLGPGYELWLVDMWESEGNDPYYADTHTGLVEKGYEQVRNNYGKADNIHLVKAFTPQAAERFDDGFFDWIYIDANHRYEPVCQDILAWWPKVKLGGVLSGHDFIRPDEYPEDFDVPYEFEIYKAVPELFGDKYSLTTEPFASWWVVKEPGIDLAR